MTALEIRTERDTGERALFIGNTGSGKTVLMQTLAAPMGSCVVFDSKHDRSWSAFAERFGYVVSGDPAAIRRHPKVIFELDTRSIRDRAGWNRPGSAGHVWTDALLSVWYRTTEGGGSTLVIIDEGMDALPSEGGSHPEADRIATSGRTQGLPLWVGAQLPIYVSKRVLSQAEHCFSFAQHLPEYRALLRERRGVEADALAELDFANHEFAHHRIGERSWTEYGPVRPVINARNHTPHVFENGAGHEENRALTDPAAIGDTAPDAPNPQQGVPA